MTEIVDLNLFGTPSAGGGWRTDLLLLNTHRDKTVEASVDVFDSNGVVRITGEHLSLQRLSVVEWETTRRRRRGRGGWHSGFVSRNIVGISALSAQGRSGPLRRGIPGGGQFHDPRKQSGRSAGLAVYNADDKRSDGSVSGWEKEYFIRTISGEREKSRGFVDEFLFPGLSGSTDTFSGTDGTHPAVRLSCWRWS